MGRLARFIHFYTDEDGGGKPTPTPEVWKTVTGSIVSFVTSVAYPLKELVAQINPVQDLHGQPNPYPAGGGKNKWNTTTNGSPEGTYNGITYTKNADGSYSLNGTATAGTWINFGNITLPSGTWTLSVTKEGTYTGTLSFGASAGVFISYPNITTYPRTETSAEETTGNFGINISNGAVVTNLKLRFQIESGSTATAWAPYSNECPISGWTGVEGKRMGKNLLNLVESEMILSGWNREFPISIKAGTYIISCQNQFGAPSLKGARVSLYDADGNRIKFMTNAYEFGSTEYAGVPTTVTEDQASKIERIVFECRAGGTTYSDIAQGNIQIELGSTASDYEEYQAEPISVTFPSANIWDEEWELGNIDDNTGQNINGDTTIRAKNYNPIVGGKSYYANTTMNIFFYDENKAYLSRIYKSTIGAFDAPADAKFFRFRTFGSYGTTYNHDISINYPLFDHDYHAHDEPMTVYGGTDEVIGGNGAITMYYAEIRFVSGKYENENGYFWYATTTNLSIPIIKGLNSGLIADRFAKEPNILEVTREGVITFYANGIIRWKEQGSMTLAEYQTYLQSNPFHICYEIATPQSFTHEGQQVETLLGQNNIFVDTGSVSVDAPRDTKLYIDKKIAEALG